MASTNATSEVPPTTTPVSSPTVLPTTSTPPPTSSSSTSTSTSTSSSTSSAPPTTSSSSSSSTQSLPPTTSSTSTSEPPRTTVSISTLPGGTSTSYVTVVVPPPQATDTNGPKPSSTHPSGTPGLQPDGSSGSSGNGLSPAGRTAIAVVVPVVVVALLVLAGIFLWRRRKQRKTAEEARRKEVEEYNYNPNHDPTLPAVASGGSDLAEDQSGYRGWGTTTTATSNRKGSTTMSQGMTQISDTTSNPGGYYQQPGSPIPGNPPSDSSQNPLTNGGSPTHGDNVGVLGAGPAAGAQRRTSIHRGPSNASSSYSAAGRSDGSGDMAIPVPNPQDYYTDNGYYQPGPYGENAYNGGQQPIIRDVSARRNTRIESPSVFPQQGNSGIAQNF